VVFYEGEFVFAWGRNCPNKHSRARGVEHELKPGDLGFLRDFAFFRNRYPHSIVADRLCERGFMAKTNRGRRRMTLKGWMAILLRKTFARKN
jgi:hypothetical protein